MGVTRCFWHGGTTIPFVSGYLWAIAGKKLPVPTKNPVFLEPVVFELLSPGKDASISRPIQCPAMGRVVEILQVGGLHHRLVRTCATMFAAILCILLITSWRPVCGTRHLISESGR
jgi:hypothetical protein